MFEQKLHVWLCSRSLINLVFLRNGVSQVWSSFISTEHEGVYPQLVSLVKLLSLVNDEFYISGYVLAFYVDEVIITVYMASCVQWVKAKGM